MEILNKEDLEEKIYRKGFPREMIADVQSAVTAGNTDIALEHQVKIKDDDVVYRLNFRYDAENQKAYLNSFDAAIMASPDFQGTRMHNFPDHQLITATEAHRMLKYGELVAVNKTLYNKEGEQYHTWLSLDVKAAKDEYNNYPVNSYHENYFTKKLDTTIDFLTEALKHPAVPVKELENPSYLANIEKALKKANLYSVTIMVGGQETQGFLGVNPEAAKLNVYDNQLKLVQASDQKLAPENKVDTPAQTPDDVKKKSGQEQKVNWAKTSKVNGPRL